MKLHARMNCPYSWYHQLCQSNHRWYRSCRQDVLGCRGSREVCTRIPSRGTEGDGRIHCVQLFYNLSDPGMEDTLYDVEPVRRFVGMKLAEPLPDETTILNFRHLLEEHKLGDGLFAEIKEHLESQGLRLQEGTIVDASIIEEPSSTKNRAGARDPEMHQVKKGNEWHFGMKVHIGVDAQTGVVHSVATTPANVHDVTETPRLLHGGESQVWGDAGYLGVQKRVENRKLEVKWQVAMRPGQRRKL